MEPNEIRYAIAIYRNLNFTRAAKQCFVTTSALSRGLRKLEDKLGAPLFTRDTHGVQVTNFGKLMRPYIEQIADGMAAAQAAGKQFLRLDRAPTRIRIGVMCTIGPERFLGFLGAFRLRYAQSEIQLTDSRVDDLIMRLLDGSLDLAIMAFPGQPDTRFETQVLYRERFRVAVSFGHPFCGRGSIPLAEAAQEPHLLRDHCEYKRHWLAEVERLGLELPIVFRSQHEDWIQSMIAGGFGISFLPEYSALVPGICLRPFSDTQIDRHVALVRRTDVTLNRSAEEFAQAAIGWCWD